MCVSPIGHKPDRSLVVVVVVVVVALVIVIVVVVVVVVVMIWLGRPLGVTLAAFTSNNN